MSCNEKTALLASQQGHQKRQQQHIIVVPATEKDSKDYEPIFTTADYSYGLTLEELLPFALDPWWQTVRRLSCGVLGLTFLLTLIAGLVMAFSGRVCQPNRAISENATMTTMATPLSLALNGSQLLMASS
ncbi:uncharacterized protein LOC6535877 [Drosophila yakuba]|uniref:Uncharacterized protein, isoform B n=1 Tax=Drosophila yakuba TaxID=7245 RepID=B4IV17_DROYA|nr:uncharacterized protein LOC6535877 [Drosophila yakuba]EDW96205.1 uncharacterized protein Dyak_GE25702, isoform D [Drosophila yakuba]EDX00231.1 uncharacterized protein Dyak_GE11222, isoform F [Drosophila yakuba]KRK02999.1 uncharacterized protein Dyak_GE25702, isoform B [Drosophila yakuba]KRK03000.1 uncharacterized protein Dyak_GE25702, isoform E [Drosophila yakuba]KRK05512.1 uncharacterized protein Dyak_GE11222, isoform C [Drosophila yakuba]